MHDYWSSYKFNRNFNKSKSKYNHLIIKEDFAGNLAFSEQVFFSLILPPIIFSAGYNLRKKLFLKNISYILIFGVLGTIVTFIFYASITIMLSYFRNLVMTDGTDFNLSIREILLFAAVLSSTDTIAAVTFIKQDIEPRLYSILFGEGIVNDAITIILFQMTNTFTNPKESQGKM